MTMSEGGYERIHQGTVLLHVFPLDLAPGASWQNTLRLKIDDLKARGSRSARDADGDGYGCIERASLYAR